MLINQIQEKDHLQDKKEYKRITFGRECIDLVVTMSKNKDGH